MDKQVSDYLVRVHEAEQCLGLEALHQAGGPGLPHVRTVYRWHRALGGQLAYFPAFTLEALGLVHLHLFVTSPDHRWARFPYAVEGRWVTENLVDPVLYLHCLVPLVHTDRVEEFLTHVSLRCDALRIVWTGSGWQRVHLGEYESFSRGFPVHTWPGEHTGVVPHHWSFAIPIIGEIWNQHVGLPEVWRRVRTRLGNGLLDYFPRRHAYTANGKRHVKDTYRALLLDGVFRQYVIKYEDDCALLVIASDYQRSLPPVLVGATRTAELFPAKDGCGLWRLQGSYDLLRERAALHGHTVYVVERQEPLPVRFCYEWLFNPRSSAWQFSWRRIERYMGVAA